MRVLLSNFYNNYIQTQFLIDTFSKQKNLIIDGVYGSFPYSFFRSEYNCSAEDVLCLYPDMVGSINSFSKSNMIILDFANPLILTKDYHNRIAKVQYESFLQDENVYISVGQKEFIKYLSDLYPYAKILLNLDYVDFEPDLNICGVISSDITKLSELITPIKILKVSLYSCHTCNYFQACEKKDHKAMLEYSSDSAFSSCNFIAELTKEEIIEQIKEAKNNNIPIVLFEPPKGNNENYYELLNTILMEDADDLL